MITRDQHRAANRFGLGASRKDAEAMGDDVVGWLDRQLDRQLDQQVTDPGPVVPGSVKSLAGFLDYFQKQSQGQSRANGDAQEIKKLQAAQRSYFQNAQRAVNDQVAARFRYSVATPTPFRERLVQFWSNHFTVSRRGKPQISGACTAYENETIRVGLDGFFADMLVRVVSHPVMLMYLDNAQSMGPRSRIGRQRRVGINENLAREILELHTLGVSGGYEQADVKALAKILTGWTVGNHRLRRLSAEPGAFAFVRMMHEPGSAKLLGKRYPDQGVMQGVDALRDLANHESTARHVAAKLVRHFVSDQPPPEVVARVAGVFMATQGHLPSVHKVLIRLPEVWESQARKLKTPHDYLVSAYRGLGIQPGPRIEPIVGSLRTMNHMPFAAPSPAGWPDLVSHWGSPSALKQRIEWGIAVGQRVGGSVGTRDAGDWLLDQSASSSLVKSLKRAESPAQALAMLIASPDFQWR